MEETARDYRSSLSAEYSQKWYGSCSFASSEGVLVKPECLGFAWFIYLMAYQHFMDYLIPKFDFFVNV